MEIVMEATAAMVVVVDMEEVAVDMEVVAAAMEVVVATADMAVAAVDMAVATVEVIVDTAVAVVDMVAVAIKHPTVSLLQKFTDWSNPTVAPSPSQQRHYSYYGRNWLITAFLNIFDLPDCKVSSNDIIMVVGG